MGCHTAEFLRSPLWHSCGGVLTNSATAQLVLKPALTFTVMHVETESNEAAAQGGQFHVSAGRPSFEMLLRRALKLRCPRCGEGPLFTSWVKMPQRCPHCGLKYERAPGYSLGSTYFNYGLTALSTTAIFLTCRLGLGISGDILLPPLMVYTVLFPLLLFRHARALWLAMDCHFDPEVLADEVE